MCLDTSLHLVALLRKIVEHVGYRDSLGEVNHWGTALELYIIVTFSMHSPFPKRGDLNENGTHRFICQNSESPGSRNVWKV